ncbi:MAG: UvrD-helicase domain-containing protein [Mycobacteriales bacterium]
MAEPSAQELTEQRQAALDAILGSAAAKKLVVAGPGTGKTYTFRLVLRQAGGGVALTFIRALVRDLRVALGEDADIVSTFHGFAKHLLHAHPFGVTTRFCYVPALPLILAHDLTILGVDAITRAQIDSAFQRLDDTDSLITQGIRLGEYYDAVGHNDVVYRVLSHFDSSPGEIPTYPIVVVDEYQDFNPLETALILKLAERSPVLIAGDDDQALYHRKHASPLYIRELADSSDYTVFPLPFCSRCTAVVVQAVTAVIERAVREGNLVGRISKPFSCYLPDKRADSDAHPKIIHARCSVESVGTPYIGRYVTKQVGLIEAADIDTSREGNYPTCW